MPEGSSAALCSGSVDEKPCSSAAAAAADSSDDVMEDAKKLIGKGNRHLVMGDVVAAVSVFQDACSMLATRYGETADECGEAFFLCGKSLLELARMENGVLGNALEGVPEESEEEEQPGNSNIESANNLDDKTRDELRKQVYDAMAEKDEGVETKLETKDDVKTENGAKSLVNGSAKKSKTESASAVVNGVEESPDATVNGVASPGATVNGVEGPGASVNGVAHSPAKETETEHDEGFKEQNGDTVSEEEASEDDDDDDDDDDDEDAEDAEANGGEKDEEEVGNLQLAWEMLEVAKVIYKRKESKEDQLMAAQTYLKLGEVSAESCNYAQALEDFQECLTLQLKHLPPHSRLLAETHYHVATSLCCMDHYSQAIQHYNSSIDVIEKRLAMLQEVIDAAKGTDEAMKERSELEELKLLLPDIKEKVEDAKESQRTASAASQAIQQALGGASTSKAFPSENGGASSSSSSAGASSSAFDAPSQIPVRPSENASSSKAAADISHLVRKKRKPEEESPVKDTDAKQAKQEAAINGSMSSSNGNGVEEEQAKPAASVETSA